MTLTGSLAEGPEDSDHGPFERCPYGDNVSGVLTLCSDPRYTVTSVFRPPVYCDAASFTPWCCQSVTSDHHGIGLQLADNAADEALQVSAMESTENIGMGFVSLVDCCREDPFRPVCSLTDGDKLPATPHTPAHTEAVNDPTPSGQKDRLPDYHATP
ncbi:hypothetical protein ACOMHN_034196 [Nucella lapillus]